jgi:hypothetical protein
MDTFILMHPGRPSVRGNRVMIPRRPRLQIDKGNPSRGKAGDTIFNTSYCLICLHTTDHGCIFWEPTAFDAFTRILFGERPIAAKGGFSHFEHTSNTAMNIRLG